MHVKFLFLFAVAFIALVGAFSFMSIDTPFNDSDLLLKEISVPETENAFSVFEEVTEVKNGITGDIKTLHLSAEDAEKIEEMLEGGDWDAEFVEDVLVRNRAAISVFDEFLRFPVFQFPELQDPENYTVYLPLRSMGAWRSLARLKALESLLLFEQGYENEAFDTALNLVRFGQIWEDAPRPFLIQYLIGTAIKEMGLQTIRRISPATSLDSQELLSLAQELEPYYSNKESLETTIKGEYITIANAISESSFIDDYGALGGSWYEKALVRSPYHFKPNETKSLFAQAARLTIDNLERPYFNQTEPPEVWFSYFPLSLSRWYMLFTPNSVGKSIFGALPYSFNFASVVAREDLMVRGTQTILALQAYYKDKGVLPRSFQGLIPEYLKSRPQDSFDGEVLRFSKQEGVIYSVGPDLQDSYPEEEFVFPVNLAR